MYVTPPLNSNVNTLVPIATVRARSRVASEPMCVRCGLCVKKNPPYSNILPCIKLIAPSFSGMDPNSTMSGTYNGAKPTCTEQHTQNQTTQRMIPIAAMTLFVLPPKVMTISSPRLPAPIPMPITIPECRSCQGSTL